MAGDVVQLMVLAGQLDCLGARKMAAEVRETAKAEIVYYGELVLPRVGGPMYKREWRKPGWEPEDDGETDSGEA